MMDLRSRDELNVFPENMRARSLDTFNGLEKSIW